MKQFFLFLLVGMVLILIQTIPLSRLFPGEATPNLSFVLVVFLALYYPSASSCMVVFLLGYVLDTLSGVPAGLGVLLNLACFFLIRAFSQVVQFESVASQVWLVFVLSFLANLFLLKTARLVSFLSLGFVLTNIFTNSFWSALVSVPLFVFCKKRGVSARGSLDRLPTFGQPI